MKNWEEILSDYSTSGLSGRRYCLDNNLNYGRFNYHKKKLSFRRSDKFFVEVETAKQGNEFLEVIYPNGVRLRAPISIRLSELKGLLYV